MDTATRDPREQSDFKACYFPKANGQAPPRPHSAAGNDPVMLSFLAVYYRINCEYARLLEVRQLAPSAERDVAEREQLREIDKALIARDQLEDSSASYGIIVEPVVQNGFTRDLLFRFGNTRESELGSDGIIILETFVPVGLSEDFDVNDLPIRVRVPREEAPSRSIPPGPADSIERTAKSPDEEDSSQSNISCFEPDE